MGILANARGVLFSEEAKKASEFIQLANQTDTPLIFLQNTTGYMVGKSYEQGGIIKDGSKMINSVANSKVPHITLNLAASFGAGNYGMDAVLDDLTAESAVVRAMVADLDDAAIGGPTPAEGWTVRDQLTHLAYFDEAATLAATDPATFRTRADGLQELGPGFPDRIAADHAGLRAEEVRAWFAGARDALVGTFRGIGPKTRLPWYGPDMSSIRST